MSEQVSVVFGATGNVGFGVAQALLGAGHTVVAPTRSAEGAGRLAQELGGPGGLITLVGDVSDGGGAQALRDAVYARVGQVDHVVASIGPWWQKGRVIDQDEAEYRAVMRASLDGHVFAAQAFLPQLVGRAGASYTIVTGAGGNMAIPKTGLLVIAVSGVFGLSRMLRAEHAGDAVRVNELMIATRVEREARAGVVPAAELGEGVLRLVQSEVRGQALEFTRLRHFLAPGA